MYIREFVLEVASGVACRTYQTISRTQTINNLLSSAVTVHVPVAHDGDAIGQYFGGLHEMCDHQYAASTLLHAQHVPDIMARARVEACGWLITQHHLVYAE